MKLGLLSDIHANSDALENVLNELMVLGIETVIVAGDTVGYYYNILLVREMLKKLQVFEVRGNHENQIISDDPLSWTDYEKKYGTGLRRNRDDLKDFGLNYIRGLQHPLQVDFDGRKILVAHGTPWDVNQYLNIFI